jgi:hypothetical protein
MKGDSEDLVKYRISRSLETLREADAMIQNGFWNASSIEFIMLVIMQLVACY